MSAISLSDASRSPERMPARVLVVLDRPALVELVTLTLSHSACAVRLVRTMEHVAVVAYEWRPEIVILDMAPNGLGILQDLKSRPVTDPPLLVMGLVDRGEMRMKLAAFDAGADDILTIPFAPEELLARVIALTRRTKPAAIVLTPVITVGGLEIDIINHTVRSAGTVLQLSPVELGLLYLLAANPGRVLTRKEILVTLYGADHGAENRVVDQHIRSLRARLQLDDRLPRFIATVPGRGYRFLPAGQAD